MHITIDKKTLESYRARGITEVRIGFFASGCEGTKVSIEEGFVHTDDLHAYPQTSGVIIYATASDATRLDGGFLSRTEEGKWVFSSTQVQSRCGCGSSFSFEKRTIDSKKLKELRKIFGKKEEICE